MIKIFAMNNLDSETESNSNYITSLFILLTNQEIVVTYHHEAEQAWNDLKNFPPQKPKPTLSNPKSYVKSFFYISFETLTRYITRKYKAARLKINEKKERTTCFQIANWSTTKLSDFLVTSEVTFMPILFKKSNIWSAQKDKKSKLKLNFISFRM